MKGCELMKISELLELLSQPENTVDGIAKGMEGMGKRRLRDAIKRAGYQYQNSGKKGWYFVGEGEEPLDKSIFDFVSSHSNSPIMKQVRKEVSQAVKESASSVSFADVTDFTQEEVKVLKEMASEYMKEKEYQTKRDVLHKRIMMLEKVEKVRKTIVISESVGAKLDKFAEEKRFNKSDLLEIAILDLINRYE